MNWLFEQPDFQTPGLELRLRLRPGVAIEALPSGGLHLRHSWGATQLDGISPAVAAILNRLNAGWIDRTQLWMDAAPCLSEQVWVLDRISFLCSLQLALDDRPLVTVDPISYAAKLTSAAGIDRVDIARLSRFAYLQRHDDGLSLESAVALHRVILHGDWGAALAGALARGQSSPGDEATLAAVSFLDATGMIEGREDVSATGSFLLETAEFHDLLFHRRSRFGRHDAPTGAGFPYLGKTPPLPALPAPLSESVVCLPVPTENDVRSRDLSLTQAMERRASIRRYNQQPLPLAQLGEFLFRCARVRAQYGPAPQAGMPYEASDRPYPSGGAIHDLELYLLVNRVEALKPGAYHYAAYRHALEPLPAAEEHIASLLQAAMRASATSEPPHVLFKIASRFGRMSWKYRSISYATTLKNVGVLYQTMYLVATAMRLAPCALGSGDDVAAEQALGLASRSEIGVGEFMLSNPPPPAESSEQGGYYDPTWIPLVAPHWGRG